jgi:hypothetical protein
MADIFPTVCQLHWMESHAVDQCHTCKSQTLRACIHRGLQTPAANTSEAWASSRRQVQLVQIMQCHLCMHNFPSKQQLPLHKFQKHGMKRTIRNYVCTTYCLVCLFCFWSRERVIAYLSETNPNAMNDFIVQNVPILPPDEVAELGGDEHRKQIEDNSKMGQRRCFINNQPCVRLSGPLVDLGISPGGLHQPHGKWRRWHA